jgi:hypothetical protein
MSAETSAPPQRRTDDLLSMQGERLGAVTPTVRVRADVALFKRGGTGR